MSRASPNLQAVGWNDRLYSWDLFDLEEFNNLCNADDLLRAFDALVILKDEVDILLDAYAKYINWDVGKFGADLIVYCANAEIVTF